MPKRRRRLLIASVDKNKDRMPKRDDDDGEVSAARGRLKGALQEALDPTDDNSSDENSLRRDGNSDSDEYYVRKGTGQTASRDAIENNRRRQPFVLKLFDRSIDLSQFKEDAPLYPICRAWIANQPKADYSRMYQKVIKKEEEDEDEQEGIRLPPPEGPPVSKIPELLPVQKTASKDNVDDCLANASESEMSREALLSQNVGRWISVRRNWQDQAAKHEARYTNTQDILNRINTNC